NTEVYRQSLEQAGAVLQDHFSEDNGQARGLRKRLAELSQREVAVTLPDLAPALQALQAYVQKRERRDEGDATESSIQPDAESEAQEAQRT
ncbi:uroporphyrinogen-III C-methyltransferase, partial [Leclercia adecarboxylata]|uniref:uroporphyrinogen-III C-methyltransferase n=1 Tax=Leclercia adecarboxylata TaxID=83655 RepID=UPI00234C243E